MKKGLSNFFTCEFQTEESWLLRCGGLTRTQWWQLDLKCVVTWSCGKLAMRQAHQKSIHHCHTLQCDNTLFSSGQHHSPKFFDHHWKRKLSENSLEFDKATIWNNTVNLGNNTRLTKSSKTKKFTIIKLQSWTKFLRQEDETWVDVIYLSPLPPKSMLFVCFVEYMVTLCMTFHYKQHWLREAGDFWKYFLINKHWIQNSESQGIFVQDCR